MRHLCVAIRTDCSLETNQRHGERTSSGTREDGTPPQSPRLFHPALVHSWLRPCEGFGQLTDPLTTSLLLITCQSENHQTNTGPWACQLPVSLLFAPPCLNQDHIVRGCNSLSWFSTATNKGHQCGVRCQLHSSMQRQADDDHFQTLVCLQPSTPQNKTESIRVSGELGQAEKGPQHPARSVTNKCLFHKAHPGHRP